MDDTAQVTQEDLSTTGRIAVPYPKKYWNCVSL
jgi:hypothetical protein